MQKPARLPKIKIMRRREKEEKILFTWAWLEVCRRAETMKLLQEKIKNTIAPDHRDATGNVLRLISSISPQCKKDILTFLAMRHFHFRNCAIWMTIIYRLNPSNAELNPICHLLALLGAHHILHVSRIRVNPLAPELFFF